MRYDSVRSALADWAIGALPISARRPLGARLPAGSRPGARIRPAVSSLQQQIVGRTFDIVDAGHLSLEAAFIADMPIAKLVMFGVLSEPDLVSLIEVTQRNPIV